MPPLSIGAESAHNIQSRASRDYRGDFSQPHHGRDSETATGSSQRDWEDLAGLLTQARSPDRQEDVILSMGRLMGRASLQEEASADSGDYERVAADFLRIVHGAADPAGLPSTRLAAQQALHSSGEICAGR